MSEELRQSEILSPGPDDGDWMDVVHRAKGARRRQQAYGLALLTALVFAGIATAYAMGHPVVDFGKAEKAPNNVVTDFGSLEVSAPENLAPGLLPDQAREIPGLYLNGKPYELYVAPTKEGGFCMSQGGCVANDADRSQMAGHIGWQLGAARIGGEFLKSDAERLEISYVDGTSDEIPFVWVTAPIDAGFFVFGIPEAHQSHTNRPTALTLFDAQGTVLARDPLGDPWALPDMVDHSLPGYPHLSVPAKAIWTERRQLFDLRADDGTRVGLWVAPSRDGGTCVWTVQSSGCSDPGQVESKPSLGFLGGSTRVILYGTVEESATRVEARFEDGDRVELEPKEGYLIWPIPSRHYPLGHRLEQLAAFDSAGDVITTQSVSTTERGLYPCAVPKDYGYGVTMCP